MARKPKNAEAILPDLNEIESEMSQVRSKGRYRQALKGTFGTFVVIAAIAVIIAFIFARALKYKRSVFTFAVTATGGVILAVLAGYMVSAALLGLNNNFIFNPAVALMYQIFPTSGDGFGEIMGGVCQALSVYALLPMIGGVVGFYLSDFMGKLSCEE